MQKKEENAEFIKWFAELSNKEIQIAGGKGASLAEMYNNKFPIPPGFVITAQAYSYFINKAGIKGKIQELLEGFDIENTSGRDKRALQPRELIEKAVIPNEMAEAITESYEVLDVNQNVLQTARGSALEILKKSAEPPFVAVRSSATTEDLADASFAGQQETFLNVKGKAALLRKVKSCFASLFTARAVYYRAKKGFSHVDAKLAVVVQKMIDADKSGVMFSKNPVSDDMNIVIEAVWGLGEGIVSGMIKPDYYKINPDISEFKILDMKVAEKKVAVVRDSSGETKIVPLNEAKRKKQVLNERDLKLLSQYAKKLEEHYRKPQDIEYAISGEDIYIVQSRPITTSFTESSSEKISGKEILSGLGASPGVSSGRVKIVNSMDDLGKIKKGDVLVTEMTNPDMVVSMQKASAIITDEGGITSHAAIVSREMGIPAVVGTEKATKVLQQGMMVTVDGSGGIVYEGEGETKLQKINPAVPTRTKLKLIVDMPEAAERAAKTGLKSVGLTRLEGIIAKSRKHPLYFTENGKSDEYSNMLFNELKKIAFYFDDIWVRTSDLRSDEFWNLEGAPKEKEGNPMLGDHGIRFSIRHIKIHEAELNALKKLAENFPEKKFGIMMPQIISVNEFLETRKIADRLSMPKNVKLGIMIETPAAVQIINQLCEAGIEFISFGTNDLTQYILTIDRNNPYVQGLFNEMHPAVLSALSYVIRRCRKAGIETSICGQAGSREEMVKFLISEGIDSISLNADAAEKVSRLVAAIESGSSSGAEDSGREISDKEQDEQKEQEEVHEEIKSSEGDIENVILQELETSALPSSEEQSGEDYAPGEQSEKDENIPSLNDAIPIASEMFEEHQED